MIDRERERERERESQRHSQREKQAPCREPDAGPDSGTPGLRPGPKAGAKLLSHPGIPNTGLLDASPVTVYNEPIQRYQILLLKTRFSQKSKSGEEG